MKTFTTTLIALLISVSAFSQQNFPKSEVKLNLSNTVVLLYPEISYERILQEDISVGASLGFGGYDGFYQNFNLTPYCRWFFGGKRETMQKAGAGFFIEANNSLYNYNSNSIVFPDAEGLGLGVGLGIGWKYLTKNNWVADLMFGGGRDLVKDGAYLRWGLTIGKRF
jgi:hypothetical protein